MSLRKRPIKINKASKVTVTAEDKAYFVQRTRPDKPVKDWDGRKKPIIKTEDNTDEKGELLSKKAMVVIPAHMTISRPHGMQQHVCYECGKTYQNWRKHSDVCEPWGAARAPCPICEELIDMFEYRDHCERLHPQVLKPTLKQTYIHDKCTFCGKEKVNYETHECGQLRCWALGVQIEDETRKLKRKALCDNNKSAVKIKEVLNKRSKP